MNEVSLLFAVLALLYLWECACWLGPTSIACVTWLGKQWRIAAPGQLVGNQRGGFVLAPPLPPLGSLIVGNYIPFAIAPDGIFTIPVESARAPINPRFFLFPEIKSIDTSGRKLFIDGIPVLKSASPTFVAALTSALLKLQSTPIEARASEINQWLQSSFDTAAIETKWKQFQAHRRPMRYLANGLVLFLFAFSPWLIVHRGLLGAWPWLLIGILALTTSIGFLFFRAHKQFFPQADDDRFTHTIILCLAPATATRAHDLLSRRIFESFHPLALAKVFCSPELFNDFCGKTLRYLKFSVPPVHADKPFQATDTFFRQSLLHVIEEWLKQHKIKPQEFYRAPQPQEETCRAYCPRCLNQFTTFPGECTDCNGVPLAGFTAVAAGKTAGRLSKYS